MQINTYTCTIQPEDHVEVGLATDVIGSHSRGVSIQTRTCFPDESVVLTSWDAIRLAATLVIFAVKGR